jgi:hypothetical protein
VRELALRLSHQSFRLFALRESSRLLQPLAGGVVTIQMELLDSERTGVRELPSLRFVGELAGADAGIVLGFPVSKVLRAALMKRLRLVQRDRSAALERPQ